MRMITMTDALWTHILALRGSAQGAAAEELDPAVALYAPIAAAPRRFVLAQVGQSLDGRVATPAGDARDISCAEGIAHLHRCRALVEAVIVGVRTVLMDDPRLSVRAVKGPNPVRVIIDCRAELTGAESLFHDGGAPVLVMRAEDAPERPCKAEIIRLPKSGNGLDPAAILDVLSARGLNRVLVEGGARTIARFMEAGLVDRLHVSIAPLIIGSGPPGIALSPIERLSSARRPAASLFLLGEDILFDCDLRAPDRSFAGQGVGQGAGQSEEIGVADHVPASGLADRCQTEVEPCPDVA
ncbi:riboflavin deaminase [Rhizobium rhizosphaerae]|uniref:Riboflavin deaminase n=1 Tax=Xaviernesmea rhizosphaerae TaxID=1672749 RepID=A0ABX3PDV8_9HYPH|nr:RibD family protein [Xaviernesmea rhizosphaerae]OQP86675.1 riboflavin deaminase [Xaviernesmea rhizosphaerae]